MGQPNATQLQNQYHPPGQFPGSSPVGMNQPGAQPAVPPVRIITCVPQKGCDETLTKFQLDEGNPSFTDGW